MNEHPTSGAPTWALSRVRLEALSDGIFAIALTILVLELKVPEIADRHSVAELARGLGRNAATFASWVLSFILLGVMWYRHNQGYRHLRHVTRGMTLFHLVQLAMAAFFPFCAALMGRYPTNGLSVVFYTGCIMIYQWATVAEQGVAARSGAVAPESGGIDHRRFQARNLRGAAVITFVFLVSLAKVLID